MKRLLALILAATLLLACAIPAQATDSRKVEAAAVLYDLGLFQGTGTNTDGTPDFSLDRAAKRAEGVTLLVRLLGIGEETLKNASDAPFSDVPGWAKPYVNFAYENDLTKGISADKLGANDAVTAAQYLTFVLRAMGYVSGEDFDWSAAWALTDRLGITHGEYNAKANKSVHGCPRRFGYVLISCILPNIEIFQLCLKDAVGHCRAQFHNSIPFQNRLLICPDHHVNMRVRIRIVVSRIPVQRRRWNMKRFCKLVLLADEQLPPCSSIVVS